MYVIPDTLIFVISNSYSSWVHSWHPSSQNLDPQPFFSHPTSPEDNGRGSRLSKLASSIIIPMLSAPVAAFVCMLGISSGTNGRWARWHPQVGEAQRKTTAAQWEWGFLTGLGAAPITWISLNIFRNKWGMCVCVCGSPHVRVLSPTFVLLSLLLFQE